MPNDFLVGAVTHTTNHLCILLALCDICRFPKVALLLSMGGLSLDIPEVSALHHVQMPN